MPSSKTIILENFGLTQTERFLLARQTQYQAYRMLLSSKRYKNCNRNSRRPKISSCLQLLPSNRAIGLDKPKGRAKGINHPKYSVKPEYACLTRESATSASITASATPFCFCTTQKHLMVKISMISMIYTIILPPLLKVYSRS